MTRTKRKNPNPVDKCLRNPKTRNYLTQMVGAVDELEEEGFCPSNRERYLANKDNHANQYDDIFIAALDEDKSWKVDMKERCQVINNRHKESNQLPESAKNGYDWPQNEKEARDIGKKMAERNEFFSANLWIFSLPFELFEALMDEMV